MLGAYAVTATGYGWTLTLDSKQDDNGMTLRYAEVAVLSGGPHLGGFTYLVPDDLDGTVDLRRGMAVVVPWRTQRAVGIVLAISAESAIEEPRSIERVLESEALLSPRQIELAQWIAARYLAPIAACVALFLPPGTPTRPRASGAGFRGLMPKAQRAARQLSLAITEAALREVVQHWPMSKSSRPANLLAALAESEDGVLPREQAAELIGGAAVLTRWLASTELVRQIDDAVILTIDRGDAAHAADSLRRTVSERRQLLLLQELADGALAEAEAKRRCAVSASDIDALEQAGLLVRASASAAQQPLPAAAPLPLSVEQSAAARAIRDVLNAARGGAFLLHGVTGSGKTEVYLAATERALALGGGVIVLVPEIALAPQTIARFEARFPGQIAVRHSRLSRSDAREQWRQVRSGQKRILIGARSALFGPMQNLRLVIVDEEHEWTYKQEDPQPRYHAVAVAREMARSWDVVTVLGSATPALVSIAAAREGQLEPLRLRARLQSEASGPIEIPQPVVDIIDLRAELAAGVRSVFSRELDAAISQALRMDQQVLLFLNRRGMSGLVCRSCGSSVVCDHCAVTMTMHRPGPFLLCHECGARQANPDRCPACRDPRIGAMNFGTAQLEEEVRRRWGDVAITRWDGDTAKSTGSHEALLEEFAHGRSRLLIGTQMIAKGLDLPRVTVAGVINADLSLRESDYTAAERTFQLLSQVAGRAGRGALGGRVIIQTYSPDHFAVQSAAAHDYDAFAEPELRLRAELDYPPFGRLARLTVSRSSEAEAEAESQRVADALQAIRERTPGTVADVIGPAPGRPMRRRDQWRRQILLKGDDPTALIAQLELGRGWSIDIDPAS